MGRATDERVTWTTFDTAIGTCAMAWSELGAAAFQLPEATLEATAARLRDRAPRAAAKPSKPRGAFAEVVGRVRAHLGGDLQDLSDVPLDLTGLSAFRADVYRALQRVPAGATVTYGELARAAGSPTLARAVGRAMATNPIPVIVPCHRVLGAGGRPGGFTAYGGLVTKDRLLAIEGAKTAAAGSLFAATDAGALPYDASVAIAHLARVDPRLGAHIAEIGPLALRLKQTEGAFAALAESIVYQQLSGRAASTIFGRLKALFPHGRLEPRRLLAASDETLRAAGLSRGKLASLRDLAERAADGRLPTLTALGGMDDQQIVDALTEVRGVGRWTVEMILIFRLGRPDVLPASDLGIRKGFASVFRRRELPAEADLARRGERWRPFRSVASWYLWRALDTP